MKTWVAIVAGAAAAVMFLWLTTIPLGIPGEWTWDRVPAEPDLIWNLVGGLVAAGLFTAFVVQGWKRLEEPAQFAGGNLEVASSSTRRQSRSQIELAVWLTGLVLCSFVWLWIVQEVAPMKNRLGKSAFVLFYASSSGYFTRARDIEPSSSRLLASYEDLMRQGDVLHTGTHPPGLFLVFHGLIAACESSPALAAVLDATQCASFREACDVIAANNLRRPIPRLLLPLDRRVLWLATLLVMLSAALAVVPLYGLICRTASAQTAWVCASLWPAIPAVAVFIPKSDVAFAWIGLSVLWLWLTAWDRRSLCLSLLTGIAAWIGLFCSLAFLPVLLAAALLTIGVWVVDRFVRDHDSVSNTSSFSTVVDRSPVIGWRHVLCIVAAIGAFAALTAIIGKVGQIRMWNVWWLNYQNHAGFYHHYARTYWKWLLVNPLELTFAAGWPVTCLAIASCIGVVVRVRNQQRESGRDQWNVIGSLLLVWGLLWLTGKNSGEAARIWILLLPWLIWIGSFQFETMLARASRFATARWQVIAIVAIQFAVGLLTVARVTGFHGDAG